MTRATAITVWEMGLPRLSALHAVSRMDDHANRHKLMQAIKGALIGYERTSSQLQPISVAGWDIQ
jgi:hypothetical protein